MLLSKRLLKLAIHNRNNQNHQHRNNRHGYNPICSHPATEISPSSLPPKNLTTTKNPKEPGRKELPTRHPPQSLHTPIHIPLTLQHRRPRMLNRLPLHLQVRQRIPSNPLRLMRNPLTIPQALRTPIQPIRPREELLTLLELFVRWGVAVEPVEEGGAVRGEGFEFAFRGVDVGFVVAEAGVQLCARGGGDVGFFEAHLVELGLGAGILSVGGFLHR